MNEYGFDIGGFVVVIEAEDEKTALHILVENRWDLIDEMEEISLRGKIIEKFKAKDMSDLEDEDDR